MNAAASTQPAPLPADGLDIADLVAADILARKAEGIRRYGTPLRANNGRDALLDAYQESTDCPQYIRQKIEELEAQLGRLRAIYERSLGIAVDLRQELEPRP